MYNFYSNCVCWPQSRVRALIDMVDKARGITHRTFIKRVDQEELRALELELGYARHWRQGLTMNQDWHVSYHRSTLEGKRVYFFTHSGIEYVFCKTN